MPKGKISPATIGGTFEEPSTKIIIFNKKSFNCDRNPTRLWNELDTIYEKDRLTLLSL